MEELYKYLDEDDQKSLVNSLAILGHPKSHPIEREIAERTLKLMIAAAKDLEKTYYTQLELRFSPEYEKERAKLQRQIEKGEKELVRIKKCINGVIDYIHINQRFESVSEDRQELHNLERDKNRLEDSIKDLNNKLKGLGK
jgi:cell division protein FtsB